MIQIVRLFSELEDIIEEFQSKHQRNRTNQKVDKIKNFSEEKKKIQI